MEKVEKMIMNKEYLSSKNRKQRTMDDLREINENMLFLYEQVDKMHEKEDDINNTWWGIIETEIAQLLVAERNLRIILHLRRNG